jgi:hypothetical protein
MPPSVTTAAARAKAMSKPAPWPSRRAPLCNRGTAPRVHPRLYGIRRARCGKRFGPTNRTPLLQARQTIKAGPSNRSSTRASLAPMSEPSTMSMFALQLGQPVGVTY